MREHREITPDELSAWLRAEADADVPEADRRLAALFAALDEPAPAAGFAGRVLARIEGEEAVSGSRHRRWRRLLLAAAALVVAAGFPWLLAGAGAGGVGAAAAVAARAFAAAGELAGGSFRAWAALAATLDPLARALAGPWLVGVAASLVLVSFLALVSLARWVEREKGVVYALYVS
ncbi:MAG: hypothetical protein M5U13_08480 [Thermoanaerobaculia bacterium]|nr:hypothetical protein [Thermoanaerobaculia bacterium]